MPSERKRKILESKKRLSESLLWNLQLLTYKQFGISAWTEKGVPSYLTSHPLTAFAYSQVALGYLRDCLDQPSGFDRREPLYIFDLGAGTGRFAFLFLLELIPAIRNSFHGEINIRYVLTDVVPENLEFCRKHPLLKPWIDEGIIDLAIYSHTQKELEGEFLISKKAIPQSLANPPVIIANYFFDTIPQDAFRVESGNVFEGLVTLTADVPEDFSPASLALISNLQCTYDYVPAEESSLSEDARYLIDIYKKTGDRLNFTIPTGGLQVVRTFSKLSNGRLLLLAGDQGVCTLKQLLAWESPVISLHGSFSFPVNYHALSLSFLKEGGAFLMPKYPDVTFVAIAGILGGLETSFPETKRAFVHCLDDFGPREYRDLVLSIELQKDIPTLAELFLLLKLGRWDPLNIHAFFEAIRLQLPKASNKDKDNIVAAIHEAWAKFYPQSNSEGDFVLNLGVLLYDMERYQEALVFFQRAQKLAGDTLSIRHNIALCERKISAL